jgi:hypothetical protein
MCVSCTLLQQDAEIQHHIPLQNVSNILANFWPHIKADTILKYAKRPTTRVQLQQSAVRLCVWFVGQLHTTADTRISENIFISRRLSLLHERL